MINFTGIHHYSVLVKDIQSSLHFYHDLLGLEIDPLRPTMSFEGAWLKIGAQSIHLMVLDNPDAHSLRPEHGGRDRHVALFCEDLKPLITQLNANNIPFSKSKSGRAALFFRDPDQNAIEAIENNLKS